MQCRRIWSEQVPPSWISGKCGEKSLRERETGCKTPNCPLLLVRPTLYVLIYQDGADEFLTQNALTCCYIDGDCVILEINQLGRGGGGEGGNLNYQIVAKEGL